MEQGGHPPASELAGPTVSNTHCWHPVGPVGPAVICCRCRSTVTREEWLRGGPQLRQTCEFTLPPAEAADTKET
jgi:hypothetical protein